MSQIKLKICGVKSADEARQLAALGVDFIGLNFIPSSSRFIPVDIAEEIARAVKDNSIQTVALFRDQSIDMVNEYAKRLDIDYVQLHGNESTDYACQVKVPVIRAIASAPDKIEDLLKFAVNFPAAYFVLDRKQQGQGPSVDIELARKIITAAPNQIFLAGGLDPSNLAAVLKVVQPYGIDIASGIRTNNKIDMAKVITCLNIIRTG